MAIAGKIVVGDKKPPVPLAVIFTDRMLQILEATQAAYGYLPVAALKRISQTTGAWYAMIYGTASYYAHLRFEPPAAETQKAAVDAHRPPETAYLAALDGALSGSGRRRQRSRPVADA